MVKPALHKSSWVSGTLQVCTAMVPHCNTAFEVPLSMLPHFVNCAGGTKAAAAKYPQTSMFIAMATPTPSS